MSEFDLDQIINQFAKAKVCPGGVSFQGRSLKLNDEEDGKDLIKTIEECTDLSYLNLEGNSLGVDACKGIAKALEKKSELKRALWKDIFTGRVKTEVPKAVEYLGNGLMIANATLTELDMSDNAFGPIGVEGLSALLTSPVCYQLQELKLNNNGLGICGGQLLSKALLQCYEKSNAAGKALSLKVFIAGRNRLENDGARALAAVFKVLGSLETISMPQNGIYYKGITELSEAFTENPNLKVLDLNDNSPTVKGAIALSKALKKLEKLNVLNLGDCLLKTKGAILIAKSLADGHEELEELHLSSNEIGPEGGLEIAIAMKNKTKLKQLILDGNLFGEAGRARITELLEKSNRISSLGSLDEDESEDEEEEDEFSEGVSSESERESGDEKNRPNDKEGTKLEEVTTARPAELTTKADVEMFLENTSIDTFLHLENGAIDSHIKELKKTSNESYVDTLVPVLMKISSLSSCSNEEVKKKSLSLTLDLYRDVFKWAQENEQISTINNALLVHLGLIKCEDKKFKVKWNVDGCLSALNEAILIGIVPTATKETLNCFLKKQVNESPSKTEILII